MESIHPLTLSQELDAVRDDSQDILQWKFSLLQESKAGAKAPLDYILSLNEANQILAL